MENKDPFIVTIHQPEHLPWLGFFDKVRQADLFVILDSVQYRKRYFQNRNKIRSANGFLWLTVPVRVKGKYTQPINKVQIDNENNPRWQEKHWQTLIRSYKKAPCFDRYSPFFEMLYRQEWKYLVDLNETIIRYCLEVLGIRVKILRASSLELAKKKGELMLEISQKVKAQTYLSGISGKEYLDRDLFARSGIQLKFQEFYHPIYQQLYEPFIPCMSVIDLLFNYGEKSLDIIKGIDTKKLDYMFE